MKNFSLSTHLPTFKRYQAWLIPIILGTVLAAATGIWGASSIGLTAADPGSESKTMKLVRQLDRGTDRAGMADYTRFPMGPSYILYPFYSVGLRSNWAIRMVPVVMSAFAYGIFFILLFKKFSSTVERIFGMLLGGIFLYQPGYAQWQGAVYEHSFALSLLFVTIGFGLVLKTYFSWILLLLGFISGWVGYSTLPGHVMALLTIRFLYYGMYLDCPLSKALWLSLRESLIFCSGVFWAILLHFIQVVFYYGYFVSAIIDLFASAVQRMGVDDYGVYRRFYPRLLTSSIDWFYLLKRTNDAFFGGYFHGNQYDFIYVYGAWVKTALAAAAGWVLVRIVAPHRGHVKGEGLIVRRFLLAFGGWAGAVAAAIAWIVIMRAHAGWHFYYTARHYLIGFFLMALIPFFIGRERLGIPASLSSLKPRTLAWESVIYGLPAVPLLGFAIYFLLIRSF